MDEPLRVLLVEDSAKDAELMLHELARAGFDCESRRVDSEADLRRELLNFHPQIVLSDFSMPNFNGMAALDVVRLSQPEIPVIFVSGAIGEDVAVEAMRAGANDYVMKTNLSRLGAAARRELRQAKIRQARTIADAGLRRAQIMAKLAHIVTAPDGSFESWSETLPRLAGLESAHLPRSTREWLDLLHPDDRPLFRRKAIDAGATAKNTEVEYRLRRFDGHWIHVRQTMEPLDSDPGEDGKHRWFNTLQDITGQKGAEERIRRLNRVYAVLSGINSLIVRVRDRKELFTESCRLAVDAGGFLSAWIAMADEKALRLHPISWQGNDLAYIESMPLDLNAGPMHGLPGLAFDERRAIVVHDMEMDSRVLLKKESQKRGFRSLAILPLSLGGKSAGVLALYAEEVGFFDEAEMKLLVELAGDISFALEQIEKTEKLDYLAYYDALTGLANRSLFRERLEQAIATAGRQNSKVAVIVHDIERFKSVNESMGRQAGDELLRQIAERFRSIAEDFSCLGRVGADQIAVCIHDVSSEKELVRSTQKRLRSLFGQPFRIGETELHASARLGIAVYPADGGDSDTLFGNAEAALKKAKATSERYLFYTEQMTERVAEKLSLENQLRRALANEEFVLHYQPKINLTDKRIAGVEALIRWQSPAGLVPPLEFIPLLEETGMILEVGAWALKRAALDHRNWTELELKAPRVSVNVSAIQLRQRDFVEVVRAAVSVGIEPTGVDLEMTESLIMEDIEGSIVKLNALRQLGINIAIDDFGTGYSSLAYLARLPVTALKIDRSFIADFDDPAVVSLVTTIISLARSIRLTVVAEGVETEKQAQFLWLLRCDEAQGYFFSKPVPADALVERLRAE